MRDILYTNAFKKDLKLVKSYREFKPDRLKEYITLIAEGNNLPENAKNHKLSKSSPEKYRGLYDFHVAPDICVVYKLDKDTLTLVRIGKHNNLGLTEMLKSAPVVE